jgi:hypothetical protein
VTTAALRNVTILDLTDEQEAFRIERDATGRVHLFAGPNDYEMSADEARLLAKALTDAAGGAR